MAARKKAALKGRWAGMPIDPLAYGSSTCTFALRNLHKSPDASVAGASHPQAPGTCGRTPTCGDWCRFRAAGLGSDVCPTSGRPRGSRRASGAHFRDFCTPAAFWSASSASFCEFCSTAARGSAPHGRPSPISARDAGGHLGKTRVPELQKRRIPSREAGAGSLPGCRCRRPSRSGPPPEAYKSQKKCTAPPRTRGQTHGGVSANARRRDARPWRLSAPRAGRAPRTHIAGCAENRPECISRQENDCRCAENRPKCVSRHEPAGTQRARTGRGRPKAFWETAGQTGDIILVARRAARGGPGRRRQGAEIAPPGDTLCPIFSTTAPFRLPENTFWPIFSTSPAVGTGLKRRPALETVRQLRPHPRCAPDAGRSAYARDLQARRLRTRLRRAATAAGASARAAPVVKTRVHWRERSRKTRLCGQSRPSLEANGTDRPRIPARRPPATAAAAAKPQLRRPHPAEWSKPAFSVPTVKAGFDHGAPRQAAETRRLRGGRRARSPAAHPQVERTPDPWPAARNLHQSPRVITRPQAARRRRPRRGANPSARRFVEVS